MYITDLRYYQGDTDIESKDFVAQSPLIPVDYIKANMCVYNNGTVCLVIDSDSSKRPKEHTLWLLNELQSRGYTISPIIMAQYDALYDIVMGRRQKKMSIQDTLNKYTSMYMKRKAPVGIFKIGVHDGGLINYLKVPTLEDNSYVAVDTYTVLTTSTWIIDPLGYWTILPFHTYMEKIDLLNSGNVKMIEGSSMDCYTYDAVGQRIIQKYGGRPDGSYNC